MFSQCQFLNFVKSLEKWNISKGTNFKGMFYKCKSLKDIKALENWNLKENIFSSMF